MELSTPISSDALEQRYDHIYRSKMQDLPFVNHALQVEAVGFREFEGHQLGVLISPWFMNLVILPENETAAELVEGNKMTFRVPSGPIEFVVARDVDLGVFLSAVLFTTVSDIPDQETARDLATEVLHEVFNKKQNDRVISRRSLLMNAGGK